MAVKAHEIEVEVVSTPDPSGRDGDEPRRVAMIFSTDDEPTRAEVEQAIATAFFAARWAGDASGDPDPPIRGVHLAVRPAPAR